MALGMNHLRALRSVPVSSIITWAGLGMAGAQAVTVAGLVLLDRRRKRRDHVDFPSAPARELQAGPSTVTVYTKGVDLYDDMMAAIDAATTSILFETYIWKADEVGQRFKDALEAAAARGVAVHVVYDVVGNLVVPRSFYRFAPGVHVLRHWPFTGIKRAMSLRSPGLNHRKMLIVDHEIAFLGGYNIGDAYATTWRDTHARFTGDAAAELENAFVDYWNASRSRGLPVLTNPTGRDWHGRIRVTRNVPSMGIFPIRYMYLEALDRAEHHVWMTHAYFIPDDDLTAAMIEAADCGVDVRVILPERSNHIVADWLARGSYRTLLRHGVRLFLYKDAMVHAKTATADGQWTTIGTANIDRLSLMGNFELNSEIIDPDVAKVMEDIFLMDAANCDELTEQEWESRPLTAKVSEWVLTPLRPLL